MVRRRRRRCSLPVLLPLVLVLGTTAVVNAFWKAAAPPADPVRPTALITGGNRGTFVANVRTPQTIGPVDHSPHDSHAGLGKATAELLVDVGYHVILTARNEAEVRKAGRS